MGSCPEGPGAHSAHAVTRLAPVAALWTPHWTQLILLDTTVTKRTVEGVVTSQFTRPDGIDIRQDHFPPATSTDDWPPSVISDHTLADELLAPLKTVSTRCRNEHLIAVCTRGDHEVCERRKVCWLVGIRHPIAGGERKVCTLNSERSKALWDPRVIADEHSNPTEWGIHNRIAQVPWVERELFRIPEVDLTVEQLNPRGAQQHRAVVQGPRASCLTESAAHPDTEFSRDLLPSPDALASLNRLSSSSRLTPIRKGPTAGRAFGKHDEVCSPSGGVTNSFHCHLCVCIDITQDRIGLCAGHDNAPRRGVTDSTV